MTDEQFLDALEQLSQDMAAAETEALEQRTAQAEARKNAELARANRAMDLLFRGVLPPWQWPRHAP